MGFLRKLGMAATRIGPLERTIDRLLEQIEARAAEGHWVGLVN